MEYSGKGVKRRKNLKHRPWESEDSSELVYLLHYGFHVGLFELSCCREEFEARRRGHFIRCEVWSWTRGSEDGGR